MVSFSFVALALAAVGANAALHETRSRSHSADLARRHRIGAIAPRDVVVANDSKPLRRRTSKKKRCKAHSSGSSSGGSSSGGSTSTGHSTGHTSGSSGGSSGGSSSGGGSSSDGGGGGGGESNDPNLVWVGKPTGGFVGQQTNAVVSWFRADNAGDSTNGNSWCGFPYDDSMPLFAPSLTTMGGATWGSDPTAWEQQTKQWCGMEAIVNWNGKSVKMYIGDGFDPAWLKTSTSIDVLQPTFAKLFGRWTDDKNDVATGATWTLTGYRNTKYTPN